MYENCYVQFHQVYTVASIKNAYLKKKEGKLDDTRGKVQLYECMNQGFVSSETTYARIPVNYTLINKLRLT